MKKSFLSLRAVALLATVVLLGGMIPQDASAKYVKSSKKSGKTQMTTPDFAYPQTVVKNSDSELEKAVAHGDWGAAVEATIQYVTAGNIISHGNAVKGLEKIDSIAGLAPAAWKPAFLLIKADVYGSIYGSTRWKADSRKIPLDSIPADPYEWSREIFTVTTLDICDSMLNACRNDSRPLKDWSKFLENATDAYEMGMTVEEFLCNRCFELLCDYSASSRDIIPFFSTSPEPVTPAQKCSALREKAIDRLIESTASRRQHLLLAKTLTDKANTLPYSLRLKYLIEAFNRVKGTEGEQLIMAEFSNYDNEDPIPGTKSQFPFTRKEYLDMLRKSVADFPNCRYVNSLRNIINDLTRPSAAISHREQYLSSSDITVDVRLSNANESYVLVYDYSPFVGAQRPPKNKEVAARCRLVKAAKATAEGSLPFSATTKTDIGKLPKGVYVLISSATPDGKGIYPTIQNDSWRPTLQVSDISVMTLQRPDAKTDVFVVDGSNGHPIEGAQVKVYTNTNYSSQRKIIKTLTTGKDGCVTVSEDKFNIEATYNGSKWDTGYRYYNSTFNRDTTERNYIQILTDRAIYHPGDTVKAVIVAYSTRENNIHIDEGHKLSVSLNDTHYKVIKTLPIVTDSFGRANVEFKIPEEGLLGNWHIEASYTVRQSTYNSSTDINVSDYVSPTFFITSEHSEEDVNPGDVVSLKGQVLTYSGMPVAGAIVHYQVSYTPPMRWYATGFATYNSSVTTDADGRYTIELPTENLRGTQFERGVFSLQLSATSPAGETQNGPTERFAVGNEFNINLALSDRKINITDGVGDIICNVTDMLGRKVKKEVAYELIDSATEKTVEKGVFTSPVLKLSGRYPSARYSLKVALTEDPEVKDENLITMWRSSDKAAPAGTNLWTPAFSITARENEDVVNVTVGSGVADRWIPAVLSADGEVMSVEWLHIEKDNLSVPVKAPTGNSKYQLNLSWMSDLRTEMANVSILAANSDDRMKITCETFRNKITPGDKEEWSFRFSRKSGSLAEIPAMAVMTDAALNALAPFSWNLAPNTGRYSRFYNMALDYNSQQSKTNVFSNPRYLSFNPLSIPIINDYGQRWGLDSFMYDFDDADHVVVRGYGTMRKSAQTLMATAASPTMVEYGAVKNEVADMEAEIEEEAVAVMEPEDGAMNGTSAGGYDAGSDVMAPLRETECPVAFFMPNLVSDKDGLVNIGFTVPDFNTTWAFQLLGYDSDLQTAKIALEAVASKPIMVSTHSPRFVRTGDVIDLTATVFNNSDRKCAPKCRIELVDLISGKTLASKDFAEEDMEVAENRLLIMSWTVPSGVSSVGFRAYAAADGHRDGEQALLPVLPASSPVVESTPFWLAPETGNFEVKLPKFKDSDQVTLQYCDNPVWYCVSALPDIVKPESKSVTAKARALFGNAVAYHLISSDAELKNGLEVLLSDRNSQFAALKSNLEKDGNLKITQLSNTPWVNNAESETLRMSRLGSLLDDSEACMTIREILDDMRKLQGNDGGWSWLPEMKSSRYISEEVLRHFAMIFKCGADNLVKDADRMIKSGIKYVDSETVKDYKKYHKKGESLSYLLDWLYVRGCFPESYLLSGTPGSEMTNIAAKARKDISSEWKDMSIGEKAKAAIVLMRGGDHKTASEILESLRQFASQSQEKGIWFDNLKSGWGGMSTIRTTTLVLEAFAEIQPSNNIIDGLRQWLVLGRQYQDWGSNTYTTETVNAILTSGSDWFGKKAYRTADAEVASETPAFSLKGKKLELPETAKLTGAFTMTLDPKEASGKTLNISRNGNSPAWGGVISQYEAPILEVTSAEVPDLSIRKSVIALVEGENGELNPKEGITLKKGMKVRVTLFITVGRDMDYVAVTDERSACLEPVDQLSGYTSSDRVGFYREVRDTNTNLFFDWLPKGTHVISYDCTVSQDGEFSCGIATAQSQYSPITVAHSGGSILTVK